MAAGTRGRPFFVTTRLLDSAGHHEQAFIAVDSVVHERLFGRLASDVDVVRGFTRGQRLSIDESALVDWMFANPDGSEEGNFVGNFLDTYVPPKTCGATSSRSDAERALLLSRELR